jgi:hypothetical protein
VHMGVVSCSDSAWCGVVVRAWCMWCVLRVACCVMRRVGDVRWPNYLSEDRSDRGGKEGERERDIQ